jgi:hypothetical protein
VTFHVVENGERWQCPPILATDWNEARDIVTSWGRYAAEWMQRTVHG